MRVDQPPVERAPATVRSARSVGDQNVGVQLRVAGARGPVIKRSREQSVSLDHAMPALPSPQSHSLAFDVGEGGIDSDPMRVENEPLRVLLGDP